MINQEQWEWYGFPGHYNRAQWCLFHLCTKVGNVIVSTVGEMIPPGESVHQEIGPDRFFETMVFNTSEERCIDPECKCGMPVISDFRELAFQGYNTAEDAHQGHMEICQQWAAKEQ